MESAADESSGPIGPNAITLVRRVDDGVKNEQDLVLTSRNPSPPSHPLTFLLSFQLVTILHSHSVKATWIGRKDKSETGDILLYQRLVKVMAKNRISLMNSRAFTDYTDSDFRIGSNSTLRDALFRMATLYDNIRPKTQLDITRMDNELRTDPAKRTNTTCPYDDFYMDTTEECNQWKAFIFQYFFPFVLILAILGNTLTLTVYRSRYLKSATSVLLLAVKAQANLAFACTLTMEMLHYFITDDASFQDIYWRSRPYTLFLANYFDSLAVWCTLVITLETYICISFPHSFRRWSKRRTIYIVIILLMISSGLLHVAYPITWHVDRLDSCPALHRYRILIRDGKFYHNYERVYFFLHALAVISLPVLLMAVFSILIGYRFNRKPMGHQFSERRRCVLRITFTTTLCSLILQTPGLIVFVSAAIRGSNLEDNLKFCTINVITTFLTILNSAAPFLVYISLNDTFRRLLFVQLGSSNFTIFPCCQFYTHSYRSNLRGVRSRGELTEPDASQFALASESNFKMFTTRRTNARSAIEVEIEEDGEGEDGVSLQNRSNMDEKVLIENVSPILNQKKAGKTAPTILNQKKAGKNAPTILNQKKAGKNAPTILNQKKAGKTPPTILNQKKAGKDISPILNQRKAGENEKLVLKVVVEEVV